MANYITVDGGTTNTRICLVKDKTIIDSKKFNIGAKKSIGNVTLLKDTIKQGIADLLKENNLNEGDIKRILASGMITSEFGLYELPHTSLPAGIDELHNSMQEVFLSDISAIPFVFMRGVKTDTTDVSSADMMRGEETELMGIAEPGECVYILPGSHSKVIKTDDSGKIVGFKTMLTGEMINALSENTILKSTLELKDQPIKREFLIKGFYYARENGLNNALFKVRVLKTIFNWDNADIYNFYMGVVLADEIEYVLSLDPPKIVISGQRQIKKAIFELLNSLTTADIILFSDERTDSSTSRGMINIYEHF